MNSYVTHPSRGHRNPTGYVTIASRRIRPTGYVTVAEHAVAAGSYVDTDR